MPDPLLAVVCRTAGYTLAWIFAAPCCLAGTNVLRGVFAVTYREDHSPETLADSLGDVLRSSGTLGYMGYSLLLALLLWLAWDFYRVKGRHG